MAEAGSRGARVGSRSMLMGASTAEYMPHPVTGGGQNPVRPSDPVLPDWIRTLPSEWPRSDQLQFLAKIPLPPLAEDDWLFCD